MVAAKEFLKDGKRANDGGQITSLRKEMEGVIQKLPEVRADIVVVLWLVGQRAVILGLLDRVEGGDLPAVVGPLPIFEKLLRRNHALLQGVGPPLGRGRKFGACALLLQK